MFDTDKNWIQIVENSGAKFDKHELSQPVACPKGLHYQMSGIPTLIIDARSKTGTCTHCGRMYSYPDLCRAFGVSADE